MPLAVYSISSGSSGNCMLFMTEKTGVLIDAGVTLTALRSALIHFGVSSRKISALFVTHPHNDHIKGIGPITRGLNIPVFADRKTLSYINYKDPKIPRLQDMNTGNDISLRDINIQSFETSHDTPASCAYVIRAGKDKICYATDTGYITEDLRLNAKGSSLLIIESNYDELMLDDAPYPEELKKRIRGRKGHLSNDTTADFIADMIESGDENTDFWLAHLSKNSNTPKIAHACTTQLLHKALGVDKDIKVALRDIPSISWFSEEKSHCRLNKS